MSEMFPHVLGVTSALAAAACWAFSSILFRWAGETVTAVVLNFSKSLVAIVFLLMVLMISGYQTVPTDALWILAVSGFIGITIGDTLFFLTLMRLGPRVALAGTTLVPVVTALGAAGWLGERVGWLGWLGIVLVLSGVASVMWIRADADSVGRRIIHSGWIFGLGYVAAEATGILLTKVGIAQVGATEATLIRQVIAVTGLAAWGLVSGTFISGWRPLRNRRVAKLVLAAGFFGSALGMWFAVAAIKYTDVTVAATLTATSPLFVLPMAAWMLKERISLRVVGGAAVAVLGVAVLVLEGI